MRVLVAMSGGVDSSVAAAMLRQAGHDVTGCTMRLWGGESDTGCCSVADVDDARRVAQQLGIDHFVFNFADDFARGVVDPYLAAHEIGHTPNPCIECNRTIKFDRLLDRAAILDFDAVATGHHAQVVERDGACQLRRGADRSKDQSYVLSMLTQHELARVLMPVGTITKDEVRARAAELGLRTAGKPDSQDVCFITRGGRADFVTTRVARTPARVVDTTGTDVGTVAAMELVTIGQRKGLELGGGSAPRYVVAIDRDDATITVGSRDDLMVDEVHLSRQTWVTTAHTGAVLAQCSAHGEPHPAIITGPVVRFARPTRRVAPGQTVALYRDDEVIGSGIAG
jgi:tRNA-uridine 2-sulfurtransferase